MIRIWGYPTDNGGVDYFLIREGKERYIREFGTADGGTDVDNKYSVEEFLKSVKSQSDFNTIKDCVDNEVENTHL